MTMLQVSDMRHLRAVCSELTRISAPSVSGEAERTGRRIGLPDDAIDALCGWSIDPAPANGRAALSLLFEEACIPRRVPPWLRSPLDGTRLPVKHVCLSSLPMAHTWARAYNKSHFSAMGTLGAILRLDAEPDRLLALTAGHVCAGSADTRRGDTIQIDGRASGRNASLTGQLLDWQPNLLLPAASSLIDAAIAELDPEELADLRLPMEAMPRSASAPQPGDAFRMMSPDGPIGGTEGYEITTVRMTLDGAGLNSYQLRQVYAWRSLSETQKGHSGAGVWNQDERLIGIHAGGARADGTYWAFAVPIIPVLRWCDASVVVRGQSFDAPAPSGRLERPPVEVRVGAAAPGASSEEHARDTAIDILARTMFGEARSEGAVGLEAVGHVVFNRVEKKSWWGRDVVSVCLKPWQFSCWNANDRNRAQLQRVTASTEVFAKALEIAANLFAAQADGSRSRHDITDGATHYYAAWLSTPPNWARGRTPCQVIGQHYFFKGVA